MFNIKTNNNFLEKKILELFIQKGLRINQNNHYNSSGLIELNFNNSFLKLKFENQKVEVKYPINFSSLWHNIFYLLVDHKVSFGQLDYFPMKELISHQNIEIKLTHTQNLIIQNILQMKNQKISKIDLYKNIWPNDVDTHINKLDTHLTNLKNMLLQKFGYNLQFNSSAGVLTFLIN